MAAAPLTMRSAAVVLVRMPQPYNSQRPAPAPVLRASTRAWLHGRVKRSSRAALLAVACAAAALVACRANRAAPGGDDGGTPPAAGASKARQPVPVSRHGPRDAWRAQLEEAGIASAHIEALQKLVRPAIRLQARKVAQADLALGQSRLGGEPDLPAQFKWPVYAGKPLAFVAQLNLEAAARVLSTAPLPKHGHLWFFYAANQQNWGFDPKDRGSSVVHYEASAPLVRRPLPRELPAEGRFQPCAIAMSSYVDIPSLEDERNPLMGSDDDTFDSYVEVQDKLAAPSSGAAHKLLGHAQTIQGAMELESALASGGIYVGDARGYKDRRAAKLAKSQYDWHLLLQIDSDEDAGMMWGDSGRIYYWLREQDLLERRFDKSWLVLQCY
jgi:uncharacterized protein YwqG